MNKKGESAVGCILFSWICSKLEHYALCSHIEIKALMPLELLGRLDQKIGYTVFLDHKNLEPKHKRIPGTICYIKECNLPIWSQISWCFLNSYCSIMLVICPMQDRACTHT